MKNREEELKVDMERASIKFLIKSPAGELNDPGSGGTKVQEEGDEVTHSTMSI